MQKVSFVNFYFLSSNDFAYIFESLYAQRLEQESSGLIVKSRKKELIIATTYTDWLFHVRSCEVPSFTEPGISSFTTQHPEISENVNLPPNIISIHQPMKRV